MNSPAPISELPTPSPTPAQPCEPPAPRRSRKKFTDEELLQHLKARKHRWYLANREQHISRVTEHYYANHEAQLERMRIGRQAKRDKLAQLEAEVLRLKCVITTATESLGVE